MTNKAPFCAFLWLTISVLSRQIRSLPAYQVILWSLPNYQVGLRNLCKLRLINDLRLYICRDKITNVVSALQIHLFLQNKAKFKKVKSNVNKVVTRDYEQMDTWSIRKNKPKTNPIQTQFKPNTNPIRTQFKPKQTQFQRGIYVTELFPAVVSGAI